MKLPTNELLLALRSPTSGWLATLVCALEEAVRDNDFSEHHRTLLRQLLDADAIPTAVSAAAENRLGQFEQTVAHIQHELMATIAQSTQPAVTSRPKLTLVGNIAA